MFFIKVRKLSSRFKQITNCEMRMCDVCTANQFHEHNLAPQKAQAHTLRFKRRRWLCSDNITTMMQLYQILFSTMLPILATALPLQTMTSDNVAMKKANIMKELDAVVSVRVIYSKQIKYHAFTISLSNMIKL